MLHSKADPFNSRPSACFYPVPGSKATSGTMQPPLIFQPAPLPFHAWHPHCAVSTFSCPICAPTGTVGLQNEVWTDALLKRRYLEAVERDSTSSHSVKFISSLDSWALLRAVQRTGTVIRKSLLLCVRWLKWND